MMSPNMYYEASDNLLRDKAFQNMIDINVGLNQQSTNSLLNNRKTILLTQEQCNFWGSANMNSINPPLQKFEST